MRRWMSAAIRTATTFALALTSVLMTVSEGQGQGAAPITRADYDAWMEEVSNWGRWGNADERGTLNLITEEKRLAALALVTDGVAVSMARDLDTERTTVNSNPFEQLLTTSRFTEHEIAADRYSIDYHGFAHSHVDGLSHFSHDGELYNGFPVSGLHPDGAEHLGIQQLRDGVVTRGVLIDLPRHLGVDYLEPGTSVTVEDLEAWERATGIRVASGDVLLLRTGRWEAVRQLGEWNFVERASGFHASVARWLKSRDVAAIGSEGASDVMPSGLDGLANPLHELVIVGMGMPVFDNLDLDAVAAAAAEHERWDFLFMAAPLRVVGGTGSPVNPLAIF